MLILSIVALAVMFCFFKSLLWVMLEITLCMLLGCVWPHCRTLTSLLLFVPEPPVACLSLMKIVTTLQFYFSFKSQPTSTYRIEPPHLRRPVQKKRVVLMKTTTVALFAVLPLVMCAYKYWEGYRIDIRRPGQKKRATHPTSPRDRTYRYNPPKFSDCVRLQSVLQDVQSHILSSSSTRLLYVVVCQMFYRQMQNPQDISKPSDDIVKDILESSWPAFLPLPERMVNGNLGVIRGQIQLNPDLIVALEKAPEVSEA